MSRFKKEEFTCTLTANQPQSGTAARATEILRSQTGPAAALGRQQSWAGRTPRIPTSRKGEQKGCHTRSGDTNPCQSCTLPTHVLSLLPKVLLPKHSRLHTLCSSFCHKSGLQKLNRFNPAPRIKTLPGVSLILFDFTMHTSELSAM